MRLSSCDEWLESEPSASIKWEPRAAAALTSLHMKQKRLVADTGAHRLTVSCPSQPSAAALPHTAFPLPACQAGGWSSRGSRWLSPPLRASPSAAAWSYRLLAADGGTTAATRAAQTADGQSICLPTERRSAPRAALAPGQHPGATQHLSHHFPPVHTRIPPSRLCSARKQQDATVPVLPVPGHAAGAAPGGRPGSPGPSELCPGCTMPVTDRPRCLGPNPDLRQPACGQASTLASARGHQGRSLGHRNSHMSERPAPSKARGTQSPATPPRLLARLCAGGVTPEPPKRTQVAPTSPPMPTPALAPLAPLPERRGRSSPAKPKPLPEGRDTAERGSHHPASLKANTQR